MTNFATILRYGLGLCVAVNLCNQPSFGQWIAQQVPTSNTLNDVYFADSTNGWVVGVDGIFHSTDGGNTWQKQGFRGDHISGISKNECFILKSDMLLHTSDTGIAWDTIKVSKLDLDSVYLLSGIDFIDNRTGWISIYGSKNDTAIARIFVTYDGGKSWYDKSIYLTSFYSYPNDRVLMSFVDSTHGWVTASFSSVFRTSDGGVTWDSLGYSAYGQAYSLKLVSQNIGWLSSDGPVLSTVISRSTDSGNTWAVSHTFGCAGGTYLDFIDSLNGWVVTGTCWNHAEIYQTKDSGSSWQLQSTFNFSSSYSSHQLFMLNKRYGWIVGSGGVVLHTTNGGITGIAGKQLDVSEKYELDQNYPNPFNPVTILSFEIPEEGYVTLEICDLLGRKIKEIVLGRVTQGKQRVEWDGMDELNSHVASGVYLYTLTVKSASGRVFSATKKMNLVR